MNYNGITTSNTATVKGGCEEEVEELLDDFRANGDVEFDFEDGEISVKGEEWFDIYPVENGTAVHADPVTADFLIKLANCLVEDDTLEIKTVGFEGTRHVNGRRYLLSGGRVVTQSLSESPRPVTADGHI